MPANNKKAELISYYEGIRQKDTRAILSKLSKDELNGLYRLYKQGKKIEIKFVNKKLHRHKELDKLWYQYETKRLQQKLPELVNY